MSKSNITLEKINFKIIALATIQILATIAIIAMIMSK